MDGREKLLAGGAGCVVVMLLGCGGVLTTLVALSRPPKDVRATAEVAGNAAPDQTVELQVTVWNDSDQARELMDLDIEPGWHKGFVLRGSDPPLTQTFEGAASGDLNVKYGLALPPQSETHLVLELTALEPGAWKGDVHVCVDYVGSCLELPLFTRVE